MQCQEQSRELKPLTIEDALKSNEFDKLYHPSVEGSPDGKLVAFTLTSPQRSGVTSRVLGNNSTPDRVYSDLYATADIWVADITTTPTAPKSLRCITGQRNANFCPVWSPDGSKLAFYSDRDRDSVMRVWIWERATNKLRVVSSALRAFAPPAWLPDSRHLIINLPLKNEESNKEKTKEKIITSKNSTTSTAANVRVYSSATKMTQNRADTSFASYQVYYCSLVLIDVNSNDSEKVAQTLVSQDSVVWYRVSPDGKHLAYMRPRKKASSAWSHTLHDIVTLPINTSSSQKKALPQVITQCRQGTSGGKVAWSPDSKRLAYFDQEPDLNGNCWVVEIANPGKARNLTTNTHPRFTSGLADARGWGYPLWNNNGDALYFIETPSSASSANSRGLWRANLQDTVVKRIGYLPDRDIDAVLAQGSRREQVWFPNNDTTSLVLVTRHKQTFDYGFMRINPTTGEMTMLREENKQYLGDGSGYNILYGSVTYTNRIVYVAQSSSESPDLWTNTLANDKASLLFSEPYRITVINPHLDRYKFGSSRLVSWQTPGGELLKGTLTLTPDYKAGKQYPLVVYQYPGSRFSSLVHTFGGQAAVHHTQLLATRGYAMLLPDLPLSKQDRMNAMRSIPAKLMPAIDSLIVQRIADSTALGVTGGSYGGYGAISLIIHNTKFAAAIANSSGSLDGFMEYGNLYDDGTSFQAWRMEEQYGGTPWQQRERYIADSPFFFLDRVRTPLLLIHGTDDKATSPVQSSQAFIGLRQLGQIVEFALYKGEGHRSLDWSYPNKLDRLNREIRWFDTHLKRGK